MVLRDRGNRRDDSRDSVESLESDSASDSEEYDCFSDESHSEHEDAMSSDDEHDEVIDPVEECRKGVRKLLSLEAGKKTILPVFHITSKIILFPGDTFEYGIGLNACEAIAYTYRGLVAFEMQGYDELDEWPEPFVPFGRVAPFVRGVICCIDWERLSDKMRSTLMAMSRSLESQRNIIPWTYEDTMPLRCLRRYTQPHRTPYFADQESREYPLIKLRVLDEPTGRALRNVLQSDAMPACVWRQFDMNACVARARRALVDHVNEEELKSPAEISWQYLRERVLGGELRFTLLKLIEPIDRLRLVHHVTGTGSRDILCHFCRNVIIRRFEARDLYRVDGAQAAVRAVNPNGYMFDLVTLRAVAGNLHRSGVDGNDPHLCVRGTPTFSDTWFSDFAWSFCHCVQCRSHIGWMYVRDVALESATAALQETDRPFPNRVAERNRNRNWIVGPDNTRFPMFSEDEVPHLFWGLISERICESHGRDDSF